MVYESDFYTTRRAYSRPTVSSYSVSYPIYHGPIIRRVYSTTYPIYSYHSIPYLAHKRLVTGTRIVTTPVRYISPIRSVSPIRYTHTTRYYSPIRFESPIRVLSTPTSVVSTPYYTYSVRLSPSYLHREYQRIENKLRSRPAYRPLEDYLNSSSYINFDDETRRIRIEAAALRREITAPSIRRARSVSPFPVTRYEPVSSLVLDSYLSRVRSPYRTTASDLSWYLDPITRRYIGKTHLASTRIVGDKAYNIRNSLYDPDRVRNDVEYLSHYLRNRRAVSERIASKIPLDSVAEAIEVAASG